MILIEKAKLIKGKTYWVKIRSYFFSTFYSGPIKFLRTGRGTMNEYFYFKFPIILENSPSLASFRAEEFEIFEI